MSFRVGFGIDFHQLVPGRDLLIGGVKLPHTKGALGHSDADVLLHAICDALLGAACLGDIGDHFPDTSSDFKNIDSKILLQKTARLIAEAGYKVENIDSTVCLEKPKIKQYIPEMCNVIATILSLRENAVSIKATTSEGMGFVGREEGVAAYATALLISVNN
jgi:2-C-methyl-D-erythritol 2,4-cyclodiphosphate synthase